MLLQGHQGQIPGSLGSGVAAVETLSRRKRCLQRGPGQSWRRSPQTPLTLSVLMKQQLTQDWLDATCANANELGGLCKYVHLRMPHHPHLLRSLPRAKQSLDMLWHCRPLPLILRLYNAWRVVKTYSAVQVRRPAHGARQHFYAGLEGLQEC